MKPVNINIQYVTRIEGHTNIVVTAREGKVETVRLEIPESPRFFEAMLVGKSYQEVADISSRICGICSIGHKLTSLKTTEAIMGIAPSAQTILLRKLLTNIGILQSHLFHYYFQAAPDYLGIDSIFPLAATDKDIILRILRLRKMANDICDLLAGRAIHPITPVLGSFTKVPAASQLQLAQDSLNEALPDLAATVKLFKTFAIPDFNQQTEYVALKDEKEYAFYDGNIASTDSGLTTPGDYLNSTDTSYVPHATAKLIRHDGHPVMVGALARFNNNHEQLSPLAQKAAQELSLTAPCHNPFMNNIAQVVESLHIVEDSIDLIDKIMTQGLEEEKPRINISGGRGVGACEVPRGTLIHDYTYDNNGKITQANIVTPTNQNQANIQQNLTTRVPQIIDKSPDYIKHHLEMLLRAYDPCITCATHLIELDIK